MGRKCSHCGNIGHNSRTCATYRVGGGATNTVVVGGGLKLFGVQLDISSSSSSSLSVAMKKSFSMDCLSSSSSSPSSSLCSSRVSVDDNSDKTSIGYLSDGLIDPVQLERKKGVPWTEEEHRAFLSGLEKLGKGDWRGISRNFVTTRTPTQVASHAQKYFLRLASLNTRKRRSSLFDMLGNGSITSPQIHTANSNLRDQVPVPPQSFKKSSCSHEYAIQGRDDDTTLTLLHRLNSFEESIIIRSDIQETDHHHPHQQLDSGRKNSVPFFLHGVLNHSLPKPSSNPSELPTSSKAPPDLELTLAAPTSLEGNNPTPNSLLLSPIRVT